jgi:hypothetical protein
VSDHNPLAAVAHGHTLAEAIVDTVREPLVVLHRDLRVIAASRSFYRTFAVEPRNTQGRKLYLLGDGQWNIPALRNVLEDIIPKHQTVEAYEVEHEFPTIGAGSSTRCHCAEIEWPKWDDRLNCCRHRRGREPWTKAADPWTNVVQSSLRAT